MSARRRHPGPDELLDRYPRQLSGGQRQRVAMGRAIVRDPQVFLFDEPLSNLDAKLRVQMRAEIKELHQRLKTTTVYVTHDQIEAMTMADKIVVMNGGNVEQAGPPLELYDRPANLFVAGFIGSPGDEPDPRRHRQRRLRGQGWRGPAAAERRPRQRRHLRHPAGAHPAVLRRRPAGDGDAGRADRVGDPGHGAARRHADPLHLPRTRHRRAGRRPSASCRTCRWCICSTAARATASATDKRPRKSGRTQE